MRADLRILPAVLCLLAGAFSAAASTVVAVRKGEHADFSRLVFDFATVPAYQASLAQNRLVLTFEGTYAFDFGSLPQYPLERISSPTVIADEGRTIVAFEAPVGGHLREFASDGRLVVDLLDEAPVEAPVELDPAPPPPPDEASQTPDEETRAEAIQRGTIRVTATGSEDGLLLGYASENPTTAAVFQRAGWLWVTFERKWTVDHSAIDRLPGTTAANILRAVEEMDHPDHTVLRYRLGPGHHIAATREGASWQVRIVANETLPRQAAEPIRQEGEQGTRLFVAAEEVGARMRVEDPEVGDVLDVIPLGDSGRGFGENRRFVQFDILRSAQGVVIRRHSNDVRVSRFTNGIAIHGTENGGGLILSGSPLVANFAADVGTAPERLIDLSAWRLGPRSSFTEIEQALLVRLSRSTPAERAAARWDLARFYLGHGAVAEAHALLQLIVEDNPDLEVAAPWRAASGIALLELGRPQQALLALLHPSLDAETEMWLWRTLAAEAAGRSADALVYAGRGEDALDRLEPQLLARVRFALARAALAEGTLDVAATAIGALQNMGLAGTDGLRTDYLYGRLADARGDLATARARYRDAAGAIDRELSARARFDLIDLDLRDDKIDPEEAIARLERLRFGWRGDELESDVLDRLAGLHIAEEQYREGLEAYRHAATIFADTPRAREITAEMSRVFSDLFLHGKADRLSPVAALGLFYDFRELTPLGAEGDRMIRHLVDRLVAVDLLDRAAELLQHQVEYRLDGAAQASVATRLAKIYLLDGKPEQALGILRATRQTALARDLAAERRLVESRALVELARYEEAEVLLEDETSVEADRIRAQIHWLTRNWMQLAGVTGRLLSTYPRGAEEPLGAQERYDLIRHALALSFTDSRIALASLRRRYLARIRTGEFAGAFDLLTSDDPPTRGELSRLVGELSQAARFRSFLTAYREEFTPASPPPEGTG